VVNLSRQRATLQPQHLSVHPKNISGARFEGLSRPTAGPLFFHSLHNHEIIIFASIYIQHLRFIVNKYREEKSICTDIQSVNVLISVQIPLIKQGKMYSIQLLGQAVFGTQ
jgi:hypothetical protein